MNALRDLSSVTLRVQMWVVHLNELCWYRWNEV